MRLTAPCVPDYSVNVNLLVCAHVVVVMTMEQAQTPMKLSPCLLKTFLVMQALTATPKICQDVVAVVRIQKVRAPSVVAIAHPQKQTNNSNGICKTGLTFSMELQLLTTQ